jgi:hypothetical protein
LLRIDVGSEIKGSMVGMRPMKERGGWSISQNMTAAQREGNEMSDTTDRTPPRAPRPKGQRADRKVLRSQKQPPSTEPQAAPTPAQNETVTLASGEKRSVTIEATNDKEWNDLVALAEGATAVSLDQKDLTHRTIAAIAALRIAHEDDWTPYCEGRGMRWRKEVKSPFRPAVMWVLNRIKAKAGEDHTTKASMIAGVLDEFWEIHRQKGMKTAHIPVWLDDSGGYTKVYRDRLERQRDPKDKIAERYLRYLNLPPQEQRDIPDWLNGFAGEVVISAHIDRNTGKLEYRSVWQPKGSSFWYSRLNQFIAARPDYGKAVEPVRATKVEPAVDHDDEEAQPESATAGQSEDATEAPSNGEDVAREDNADIARPEAATHAATSELGDENDDKPLDPEIRATIDKIRSDFDASMADLHEYRQGKADREISEPAQVVPTSAIPAKQTRRSDTPARLRAIERAKGRRRRADPAPIESTATASGGPLICELEKCRYSGCQQQGRCLAAMRRGEQQVEHETEMPADSAETIAQ